MADGTSDKVKGLAKEVAGKATGSDEWVREGQAQQEKGQKLDEAQQAIEDAAEAEDEERRHQ